MIRVNVKKNEMKFLLLWLAIMLLIAVLSCMVFVISARLTSISINDKKFPENLSEEEWNRFRAMEVMNYSEQERTSLTIQEASQRATFLTVFWDYLNWMPKIYEQQAEQRLVENATLQQMTAIYEAVLEDIVQFPIEEESEIYFDDSWMAERTYGGNRTHEGCDIFDKENQEGRLLVCSASDGVVENIGWLTLGGYRVGIRTNNGLYCYYAHLDEFTEGLSVGDTVKAGDILGTMGNTGYGEEGTKGKFVVHLHFGVYFMLDKNEISINPYPIIKNVLSLPKTMLQ